MGIVAEKKEKQYVSDNAQLMAEWNWERNIDIEPSQVTLGSGKKVWWICRKGHEWQAAIYHRNKGHRCPYCSGRLAITGQNDLQTVNPILAHEWNYEKNNNLSPTEVLPSCGKKVWWVCSKGHEWQATINHRYNGRGCPICKSERKTSFPEYALLYYLQNYGLEAIHLYKENGYELDIYIPSKRIAIEYDGYLWHKNKMQKDLEKNRKCEKDGIELYRIREGLPSLNDTSKDYLVHRYQDNLALTLNDILSEIIETTVDVNLERDAMSIESLRTHEEKECSFLLLNPEIAKEWHYEKNGNLKPENVTANTTKKVWWICHKGHEWQATIASRNRNHGCPYCAGRYPVTGENDLLTVNPTLASEWNYEKNKELKPEHLTPNSGKKVWWICSQKHEWQAAIYSRSSGCGCPYCAGNKVLRGYNDLQTVNPTLATEWNYEKNDGLTPLDVLPNSDKKVWWKCCKGHEWQSTIGHRNHGRGCPKCNKGRRPKAK